MFILKIAKSLGEWVLTVFLFLGALVFFPSVGSLFLILAGVVMLPIPTVQGFFGKFKLRGKWKTGVVVLLFVIGFTIAPSPDKLDVPNAAVSVSRDPDTGESSLSLEPEPTPEPEPVPEPELTLESETSPIDYFLEQFPDYAGVSFDSVSEIDIHDKERGMFDFDNPDGYYRTEYRLGAFKSATAKRATFSGTILDAVCYGYWSDSFRIYINQIPDVETAYFLFASAAQIMDSSITADDLQSLHSYLLEYGEKNGIYIGEIKGYIIGKRISGESYLFELMVDTNVQTMCPNM